VKIVVGHKKWSKRTCHLLPRGSGRGAVVLLLLHGWLLRRVHGRLGVVVRGGCAVWRSRLGAAHHQGGAETAGGRVLPRRLRRVLAAVARGALHRHRWVAARRVGGAAGDWRVVAAGPSRRAASIRSVAAIVASIRGVAAGRGGGVSKHCRGGVE
jgi:hypothetical protein